MRKSVRQISMTSTQIFKSQAENIFRKLRHENTSDGSIEFRPMHLGGLSGQRDILTGKNVMREITVVQE